MIQPDDGVLPFALMQRKDVKPSAKVVWMYLQMRQGRNAKAWPNVGTIAKDTGLNRSTVMASISELEALELLSVDRAHGRGSRYQVVAPPSDSGRISRPVGDSDQSEIPTTTSRDSRPPPVGDSDHTSRNFRPVTLTSNPSSEPESAARERAPAPAREGSPTRPHRPIDPMDFDGAPAEAARGALNAALSAAGRPPRGRGGYSAQSAWRLVAMAAAELASSLKQPVDALLAQSARGFVVAKGTGQTRPEWWAEDFEGYFEKGREGPGPVKAASPELAELEAETSRLLQLRSHADPADFPGIDKRLDANAAKRRRLKQQIQETAP